MADEEQTQDQNQAEDEKTVQVAEMKRRLEKEQDKYQKQIDELKENQEEAVKKAYEQAQKEAKMSADELADYRIKETERKQEEERQKYEDQIAEYQRREKQREIHDESINKLDELNIPVNQSTLDLVQADSLDGMSSRADALAKVISAVKSEYATSKPPKVSGGTEADDSDQNMFDILDQAKER